MDIKDFLDKSAVSVEKALNKWVPSARTKPSTLHTAMRYSLFAGGKRVRPALVMASSLACGGDESAALPFACAVECIHTYSLIHDDLPCMDDDDFRRGKPTSHKVYGEGIAVLAGDALLTIAFEMLQHAEPTKRYNHRDFLAELTSAAGSRQLIAGQVADLEGEGRDNLKLSDLKFIHERKTSALLQCSARLGGMAANATPRQLEALTEFGYKVGLAFQVIDDILDVTQTSENLGKTAGKDVNAGKLTYPSLMGLERSRKYAEKLTNEAFASLLAFRGRATHLKGLAEFLLARDR
jgi:geranylgeranyl diphosphate synthase type II